MSLSVDDTGQQFINGSRRRGSSSDPLTVTNPSNGDVVATDRLASVGEVDDAVAAARAAFPGWEGATPAERSTVMHRLAAELDSVAGELATAESRQAGKPIRLTTGFDVPGPVDNVPFFAGAARNIDGKASAEHSCERTSTIRREPIGVVGSIASWNYPLQMAAWKILTAIGVTHRDVGMVSFTGSTRAGSRVGSLAVGLVKRVHVELCGKAPFVVFDDADLEGAARGAVAGSLINAGQDCTAATRAYVQRPLYDAFIDRVAELMSQGARLRRRADHRPGVAHLVRAPRQGRRHGRPRAHHRREGRDRRPTLRHRWSGARGLPRFAGPTTNRPSWSRPRRTPRSCRRRPSARSSSPCPSTRTSPDGKWRTTLPTASPPRPGPATSSAPSSRAEPFSAGCDWINDRIPIISQMSHGGYKASGFGKDMSTYSFDEYTQVKHVMSTLSPQPRKDWHDVIFTSEPEEDEGGHSRIMTA